MLYYIFLDSEIETNSRINESDLKLCQTLIVCTQYVSVILFRKFSLLSDSEKKNI